MTAASLLQRNPDEQLLVGACHGDRDSWQALVDRYAETVWDLSERLVGSERAESVSQLVWLRLVTALPGFEAGGRLSLWLHRAVWDECTRLAPAAG